MSAGGLRPLSHLGRSTLSALVGAALVLLAACAAPAEPPPGPTTAAVAAAASAPAAALGSSPPSESPRGTLVIHGTGDVNLDPSYIPALRSRGYEHAWTGLHGLFTDDDLTIVNMECPVSDHGTIVPKEFNFRCDPAALPAAQAAGVDVANLANNHSGDFGPDALLDSVERLRSSGIAPVGVGENLRAASTPAVVERDGWRIAVLGFGGVVPAADWLAGPSRPGMASGDDTAATSSALGCVSSSTPQWTVSSATMRTGYSPSAPTATGRSPGDWATTYGRRCPTPARGRPWPSSW